MKGETHETYPLPIVFDTTRFRFQFQEGAFGAESEVRRLEDIRESLSVPDAEGPEKLYAISMDVGLEKDRAKIAGSNLMFCVVGYAEGKVGDEPIRSQGHVHSPSPGTKISPPEIFEIWQGTAVIYIQERVEREPGRCFAVTAKPHQIVVCPPGWGHMVVNADTQSYMVFAAMCDRSYSGFEYENVKKYRGLAHYPKINSYNILDWKKNPNYLDSLLIEKAPEKYWFSDIFDNAGLYESMIRNPEDFNWIHDARLVDKQWENFVP